MTTEIEEIYGVIRSDGYCFVAVPCADGQRRVIAGCRWQCHYCKGTWTTGDRTRIANGE